MLGDVSRPFSGTQTDRMQPRNKFNSRRGRLNFDRSALLNFGLAFGLVSVATALNLLAWPAGSDQDGHYFALLTAVLIATLFGKLSAGVSATVLSALSSAYFILRPQFSLDIASQKSVERLAVFVVEGMLLSLVANIIRTRDDSHPQAPSWARYAVLPVAVTAATLPKLVFSELGTELPFAFNYAAVCACVCTGGPAYGAAATGILAGLTKYLFLQPSYSFYLANPSEAIRVGLFVSEGLLLTLLLGSVHIALKRQMAGIWIKARACMAGALTRDHDTAAMRAISRDTIWEWELDTGEIIRTPSWQDSLSTALPQREDFVSWVDRIHPDDRQPTITRLHRAMEEGSQELQYTYRLLGPDGTFYSVADHAFIVRGVDWKPVRVIGRSAELPTTYD